MSVKKKAAFRFEECQTRLISTPRSQPLVEVRQQRPQHDIFIEISDRHSPTAEHSSAGPMTEPVTSTGNPKTELWAVGWSFFAFCLAVAVIIRSRRPGTPARDKFVRRRRRSFGFDAVDSLDKRRGFIGEWGRSFLDSSSDSEDEYEGMKLSEVVRSLSREWQREGCEHRDSPPTTPQPDTETKVPSMFRAESAGEIGSLI